MFDLSTVLAIVSCLSLVLYAGERRKNIRSVFRSDKLPEGSRVFVGVEVQGVTASISTDPYIEITGDDLLMDLDLATGEALTRLKAQPKKPQLSGLFKK
jgi:hypothetical protein